MFFSALVLVLRLVPIEPDVLFDSPWTTSLIATVGVLALALGTIASALVKMRETLDEHRRCCARAPAPRTRAAVTGLRRGAR